MKCDFSGFVTKNDMRCTDGLTIRKNAFAENDKKVVPLVWQHDHNDPENILGQVVLENQPNGVYGYATFNGSPRAEAAKEAVRHGDIVSMSIYANRVQKDSFGNVTHGDIKEVSLVLSGANPGAMIDQVRLVHGDVVDELDDEVIIYTGEEFSHSDEDDRDFQHADDEDSDSDDKSDSESDETIGDVFDSLTEKQKNVVYALIGNALESTGQNEDTDNKKDNEDAEQADKNEGETIMHNAFENSKSVDSGELKADELRHDEAEMKAIFADAQRSGRLSDAVIAHAQSYGITNIDTLFPDARAIRNTPDYYKRRTEWVNTVMNGTNHVPWSRIKSVYADLTEDEARAKGYTLDRNNNNRKVDEVISVAKRETTPQTVYKRQRLDRDDILDITDFDVVAWMKQEMRIMLDEELARAFMIGDGRLASSKDKIKETNIRPIAFDDDLYTVKVDIDAAAKPSEIIDAVTMAMVDYEGSGSPTLFAEPKFIATLMTARDSVGNRQYRNRSELVDAIGVTGIVEIPVMKGVKDSDGNDLKAIIVNLRDYTVGSDRGGQVSMFDDFDLDFNQQIYLMETRVSGALTRIHSAIAIMSPKGE